MMRLLKLDSHGEIALTENLSDNLPPYAILSHTWGADSEEVGFDEIRQGLGKSKAGYAKLRFCAQQAKRDDLAYFWVDTCCINKTSDAELSEALNSMFQWYKNADRCYVFLSDVSTRKHDRDGGTQRIWQSAFRKSRWFTRGWTLQELLAPTSVQFFSRDEDLLGSKMTLETEIQDITSIPLSALRGASLTDFAVNERMRWRARRDTKRPEDKIYCMLGILDVSLAPIYGEGESKALTRLKDALSGNYRGQLEGIGQVAVTVGSPGQDSDNANTVPNTESEMSPDDRRKILLDRLSFEQMDSRRATVKNAYSTTCTWLLEHPVYLDWKDPNKSHQHLGFFWINGKPGAGKSTLMKFAVSQASRERQQDEILLSFFFNARGAELERSTLGMYRALLFQLLSKASDLQLAFDDDLCSLKMQNGVESWTIEHLQKILVDAVSRLGQRRLTCFIDALDECDEQQVQDMVHFFEELGSNNLDHTNQISVCLASRHYPAIDIGSGLKLILEDEQGHGEDLSKYIQKHLRAGKGKYIEEVRAEIHEKANGIFMWAVLVIDILNKEFLRGRIFAVKDRLREIPPKLSDLFKDILRRDSTDMSGFLLCLQWILFAKRPLHRGEYYFAMVAGLNPNPLDMSAWSSDNVNEDDMTRFVLDSSKGLAELTKSRPPLVQFIHESVRDFLLKDGGLSELWPELGKDPSSLSHDRLKRCCQNYLTVDLSSNLLAESMLHELVPKLPGCTIQEWLEFDLSFHLPKASSVSMKDIRNRLEDKFPFLRYACQFLLYHAEEAAKDVSQDEFVNSFARAPWIQIANLIARYETRRYSPSVSLIYLLAESNHARLIKTLRRHNFTLSVKGERYRYPLFAALANGRRDAARALLAVNTDSSVDPTANLEFGSAFKTPKHSDPLLWALEQNHETLSEQMIKSTNFDLTAKDSSGSTALTLAMRKGYGGVVELLLTVPYLHVHLRDQPYMLDLKVAAQEGYGNVVRILLKHGSKGALSSRMEGALLSAVKSGRKEMLQILLDHSDDVGAFGGALVLASEFGKKQMVLMLLDRGADVDYLSSDNENALISASEYGHKEVVQKLLDHGARTDTFDWRNETALMVASKKGYKEVVKILLCYGAGVDTSNSRNETALMLASQRGHKEVVQILLDYRARVDTSNSGNEAALILASQYGYKEVVQILLDYGAGIDTSNSRKETALMLASQKGYKEVVQILLDRGASVDYTSNLGNKTALTLASRYGRKEIVKLLLDYGARVDTPDSIDETALILAAQLGHKEIVKILLNASLDQSCAERRRHSGEALKLKITKC